MLESPARGETKFRREPTGDFKGSKQVNDHFDQRRNCIDTEPKNRIYIMEGLAQDYIAAFGGFFMMDPSFWLRQERTCPWSLDFTPTSDALPPPTMLNPDITFMMQYCELREFHKSLPSTPRFCNRTGRHVGMTAARTKTESTVAILRRKVSWWCRKAEDGGSWDGKHTRMSSARS